MSFDLNITYCSILAVYYDWMTEAVMMHYLVLIHCTWVRACVDEFWPILISYSYYSNRIQLNLPSMRVKSLDFTYLLYTIENGSILTTDLLKIIPKSNVIPCQLFSHNTKPQFIYRHIKPPNFRQYHFKKLLCDSNLNTSW